MPSTGEIRREQVKRRNQEKKIARNDIGTIPPCLNKARRKRCEKNPETWLKTYLPDEFFLPFSNSQKQLISLASNAIKNKGYQNINSYRGIGKTTIFSGLVLRALCMGDLKNVIYITAEGGACSDAAQFFTAALEEEPEELEQKEWKPLFQDYPEIGFPLIKRGGVAQRPLTHNGRPCKIIIAPEKINLPMIDGTPASGGQIAFKSINSGGIRGSKHPIRGLGSVRVDGCFIDDVQSDGTAKSQTEVDNIISIIDKTIKGLSGRDRKTKRKAPLTVLSALTQNQPYDVAQRILEKPIFCTVIQKFLHTVPTDFSAWKEYKNFFNDCFTRFKDKKTVRPKLNEYYQMHKDELEYNIEIDNPDIYEPGQLSPIQYALEYWCDTQQGFWCELQNDAIRAAQEHEGGLTPIIVMRKKKQNTDDTETQTTLKRYWIPDKTELLTAYIDAGEHYLNYQVTAFGAGFSFSHVVDFGVFPDQGALVTSKKSFSVDIQDIYQSGNKFDKLSQAALECMIKIFTQPYYDQFGRPTDINFDVDYLQNAHPDRGVRKHFKRLALCGIDCSDGEMEIALWRAVDRFHCLNGGQWAGRAIPCYGTEARARLLRYLDLNPGEYRRGRIETGICDWIENPIRSRGLLPRYANIYASLLYDANTFKTVRDSAWKTPLEKIGTASLADGIEKETETMYAEHQCSEEYTETAKGLLIYKKWKMKRPRTSDNEFLDTDAGTWALANYAGIEYDIIPKSKPKAPRLSREEALWIAQERMNGNF